MSLTSRCDMFPVICIHILINTDCRLVTSLWHFSCRDHGPGWYQEASLHPLSLLSAPLEMHLLWVTWDKQLSSSLYLTITGQGHCLWLRHTAPLAAASFHISWPQDGLALTVPSLSGARQWTGSGMVTMTRIKHLLLNLHLFNKLKTKLWNTHKK